MFLRSIAVKLDRLESIHCHISRHTGAQRFAAESVHQANVCVQIELVSDWRCLAVAHRKRSFDAALHSAEHFLRQIVGIFASDPIFRLYHSVGVHLCNGNACAGRSKFYIPIVDR